MKSIIIGAGTYGEVYLTYLRESGIDVVGFLDDDPANNGKLIRGVPVIGASDRLETLMNDGIEAVYCPVGTNRIRVGFLEKARSLGYKTPNFIHRSVIIAPEVTISDQGVYILQATHVMPYVTIEKDVMISTGSNIAHHSHLKQGTFVSTGVNLGARVVVEKYAYVGIGATVMTGVKRLGEDCLIGAGAVVVKDVEDNAVMAGVPAKCLRYK